MRPIIVTISIIAAVCVALAAFAIANNSPTTSHATSGSDSADYALTSPEGHETIKADIIDPSPSSLTIDVKKLTNVSVDEEAPTFAVYTTSNVPDQCGDFTDLELHYEKPDKYTRVFDLSDHTEVLDAIEAHGCVVMKNIPPKAG